MTPAELFNSVEHILARQKELDAQLRTVIVLLGDLRREISELHNHVDNRLNTLVRQGERTARALAEELSTTPEPGKAKHTKSKP